MATEEVTITLDPDVLEQARAAAGDERLSVSAWMASAVRQQAHNHLEDRFRRSLLADPETRAELEMWEALSEEMTDRTLAKLWEES